VVDKARGKLEVAPCFLPTVAAGPYWVLEYSEEEGYALISGAWSFVFSAIFDHFSVFCWFDSALCPLVNVNITMGNHNL
jgi:hypothetical protein